MDTYCGFMQRFSLCVCLRDVSQAYYSVSVHCKSYSHFFSKKVQHICVSLDVNSQVLEIFGQRLRMSYCDHLPSGIHPSTPLNDISETSGPIFFYFKRSILLKGDLTLYKLSQSIN